MLFVNFNTVDLNLKTVQQCNNQSDVSIETTEIYTLGNIYFLGAFLGMFVDNKFERLQTGNQVEL